MRTDFGCSYCVVGDGLASTLAGGIAGCSSEPLAEFSGVGDGLTELSAVGLDSAVGVETGAGVRVGVACATS